MKSYHILLLAMVVSGCGSAPKFTSRYLEGKPAPDINYAKFENAEPIEIITGVASYYADKYHGRLTANGEVYDMNGLTAAHSDMPFETIIRVVNIKNNKSAIIRVNDRMPFRPDRIIDLSFGTAKALDMVRDGIVEVRLEILEWGEE